MLPPWEPRGLSQGGSGLDQGSVGPEAGGRWEDMCLMLKVLSPLKTSPLSGSQCSCKGRMCHRASGGISAFESLGLVRASCAPSSYASSIRSGSPEGALRCISLAWLQGAALRGPGDGISAPGPSGQKRSQGGFSRLHCPSRAPGQAEGRGVCLEIEL